jgi:hypothetical protein
MFHFSSRIIHVWAPEYEMMPVSMQLCLLAEISLDRTITATNSTAWFCVGRHFGGFRCKCISCCHMVNTTIKYVRGPSFRCWTLFCILWCLISNVEWPLSYISLLETLWWHCEITTEYFVVLCDFRPCVCNKVAHSLVVKILVHVAEWSAKLCNGACGQRFCCACVQCQISFWLVSWCITLIDS